MIHKSYKRDNLGNQMNKLYAAVMSVPFLIGCGKDTESIDTRVEQASQITNPALQGQTERPSLPPCSGAPDIQKLFQSYEFHKSKLLEAGLTTPSIKRAYEYAEAEIENAKEALTRCRELNSRLLYMIANQYAASAVSWITEATQQQWEPIFAEWERKKKR